MSQLRVSSVTDLSGAGSTYAPGHVVQVVSTTKTDVFSLASTTFTEITGLTATITPKSTSSKILVNVSLFGSSNFNTIAHMYRLMRAATPIGVGDAAGSRTQSNTLRIALSTDTLGASVNFQFLDSPSSTSALTYSVQVRGENTNTLSINRSSNDIDSAAWSRSSSTITLMEIAQ
jgi:hypothetical protein